MKSENQKEHFDNLAEKHGISWWGAETRAGKRRYVRRAEIISGKLREDSGMQKKMTPRNLEIGCGLGNFTELLCGVNISNLTAVDISYNLLKKAKTNPENDKVDFLLTDCEKTPFKENMFDSVVGNAVIHHLNLDILFNEIERILKPSGKIIFFEPNRLNPEVWLEKSNKYFRKIFQHSEDETSFYKKDVSDFLKKRNWENIEVTPFDFLHPATPAFLIKAVEKLGNILEHIPLIKEIGGSLIISAEYKK